MHSIYADVCVCFMPSFCVPFHYTFHYKQNHVFSVLPLCRYGLIQEEAEFALRSGLNHSSPGGDAGPAAAPCGVFVVGVLDWGV